MRRRHNDLRVRDLNADNADDVVVGAAGGLRVRFGDGTGGFSSAISLTHPGGYISYPDRRHWTIGDFNQDQILDLAKVLSAPASHAFSVWLGQPGGTFGTPTVVADSSAPNFGTEQSIVVGDFSGDEWSDVLIAGLGSQANADIVLHPGDGSGGFGAPLVFPAAHSGAAAARALFAFDSNADDALDAIYIDDRTGEGNTTAELLVNDGTGRLSLMTPIDLLVPRPTQATGRRDFPHVLEQTCEDAADLVITISRRTRSTTEPNSPGHILRLFGTAHPASSWTVSPRFSEESSCPFPIDHDGDGDWGVVDAVTLLVESEPFVTQETWLILLDDLQAGLRCLADQTTQNSFPGDDAFGAPDGLVTGADLLYFVNAWVRSDLQIADITTQERWRGRSAERRARRSGHGHRSADVCKSVVTWVPPALTSLILVRSSSSRSSLSRQLRSSPGFEIQ